MKQGSYGWPLLLAGAGTVVSLALPSRSGHVILGTVWAGLSALHAWQYRDKLKMALKGNGGFFKNMNIPMIPSSKLELFIRTVEVASYVPGRIRLYSHSLIGSEALAGDVKKSLGDAAGVTNVNVNTVTGSILIEYDPKELRKDPKLLRIEEYIRTHVKKRKG